MKNPNLPSLEEMNAMIEASELKPAYDLEYRKGVVIRYAPRIKPVWKAKGNS